MSDSNSLYGKHFFRNCQKQKQKLTCHKFYKNEIEPFFKMDELNPPNWHIATWPMENVRGIVNLFALKNF